ncbi:SURF1 family protein [Shewanella sp. 4_MG-2023]|nr:SURF1 family protein [Shewanella sp. 4_MG-2023]MDO6678099.1 SURF1 family protein [Shewanella sp. 4_MG-2023]
MNTSSSTKTSLKITKVSKVPTGSPLRVWRLSTGLLLVVTVSVFSILVKLGLWQLDRGIQKQAWQATLSERQASSELDYHTFLTLDSSGPLTGYRIKVTAKPVNEQILLLDNQVYNGQVGYLAYQVFAISATEPWLLVELGFTAANKDRRILPDLAPLPAAQYQLTGRVYQRQTNPLSDQLYVEQFTVENRDVIRFQNLNLVALAEKIGHQLAPAVLQPDITPNMTLAKPWTPIPLSAQKHQGYALQWFTMAAVFLSLMLWLGWKTFKPKIKT